MITTTRPAVRHFRNEHGRRQRALFCVQSFTTVGIINSHYTGPCNDSTLCCPEYNRQQQTATKAALRQHHKCFHAYSFIFLYFINYTSTTGRESLRFQPNDPVGDAVRSIRFWEASVFLLLLLLVFGPRCATVFQKIRTRGPPGPILRNTLTMIDGTFVDGGERC